MVERGILTTPERGRWQWGPQAGEVDAYRKACNWPGPVSGGPEVEWAIKRLQETEGSLHGPDQDAGHRGDGVSRTPSA